MIKLIPSKFCPICNVEFFKKKTTSKKQWKNKSKYCSVECCLKGTFKKDGKHAWNRGLIGYNKDYPRSEEWKRKISEGQKGVLRPDTRGAKHHNWKGGSNSRTGKECEHMQWRIKVFERDNYTCQLCGNCSVKSNPVTLNAHHIKTWANFEEGRLDINNGITLCLSCHRKTFSKETHFEELFFEVLKKISYTRA